MTRPNLNRKEAASVTQIATADQPCPTSVYLYFDRHGILLYVGVTARGISRQREHNADKSWWFYVARQDLEHYPTREEALAREQELIELMSPPFNSVHNPDRATREAYLDLAATGPVTSTPDKWMPLRPGLEYGYLLVLLTRMEHAGIAARISPEVKPVINASGFKVRDLKLQKIGSAIAIAMNIKDAPPCLGAEMKYKHAPGGLEIKIVNVFFSDPNGVT